MRYFHLLLTLMLVVFAGLQYNDPDWYYWGPVYLVAALWSFLASRQPESIWSIPATRYGAMISIALFTLGFASLFSYLGPGWIHVEEAREDLGYMICAATTSLALWDSWRTVARTSGRSTA
jgi:cytochrome c biogenesis protein CcdA